MNILCVNPGIYISYTIWIDAKCQQPAVKASPHFVLKAIYSRSLKSAQALSESAGHVDLYSNDSGSGKTYHDLLLRSDIDAIIVALPIKNQPEYIEAALKAGKHVLSEKPIAENLKDAEHLIRYYNKNIDKSKVTWGVAENFRFLESYAYAGQQVEKLGKVLGFQVKIFNHVEAGNQWYGTLRRFQLIPIYAHRILQRPNGGRTQHIKAASFLTAVFIMSPELEFSLVLLPSQ